MRRRRSHRVDDERLGNGLWMMAVLAVRMFDGQPVVVGLGAPRVMVAVP